MVYNGARRRAEKASYPAFSGGAYGNEIDTLSLGGSDNLSARGSTRHYLLGPLQSHFT